MPRVTFYILADAAPDAALRFACRLTEKAHAEGHRVYWRLADEEGCRTADELLWTFRQGSFVPHARVPALTGGNDPTPVALGTGEPPAGFDDVLINLHPEVPDFFGRFQRTAEIVSPNDRQAARRRYKIYQAQGCEPETHKIT